MVNGAGTGARENVLAMSGIVLFCAAGGSAMTSAGETGSRGFLLPYVEIFRIPRAWCFSVAGIVGRMPMAMFGLGTVLFISAGTGRYGLAGSVSAAGSLSMAVCAPQIARLVDSHGQRRVLVPLCVVFATSVAGLVAAVELRAPDWALFLPGALGGATMPALGPMARARWSALLAGSPRLHTAFSLESVADELCFVIGPAAVTVLATQVHPAAGIVVAAVACLAGTLWFASQRDTEPPIRPRAAGVREASEVRGDGQSSRFLLPAPGLAVLVPVYLFLGAMFVAVDLSTVAFAAHAGHKQLAGFVLGCYALGSGTGGLWYGTRSWRAPASRRLAVTLTLTVAGVCTFWAMPNLLVLTCMIYLCGLTIAPTLIAGYSLMESQALPGRTTEAMSWLSTGVYIGVASGATAAGFVLDAFGPRWGYAFAACCGGVAVLLCLAGLRRLSPSAAALS
jgi:predicted MFS family arabinose efflux permease